MKIYFIDGEEKPNGENAVWNADWQVWCCGYYKRTTFIRLKRIRERVVVVRQKSKLFTCRILIHELAHWLVDHLICSKPHNKFDRWIDKHI